MESGERRHRERVCECERQAGRKAGRQNETGRSVGRSVAVGGLAAAALAAVAANANANADADVNFNLQRAGKWQNFLSDASATTIELSASFSFSVFRFFFLLCFSLACSSLV